MASEWNWADDSEAVIVESVHAVAIYTSQTGNIVIRQQDGMGDDDSVIVIPRASVSAIVKALKAEAARKLKPEPK